MVLGSDLTPGLPVFTLDGEELGTVKEVREEYFKVDTTLQPDYWLRTSDVLSVTVERVSLRFEMAQLGDSKVYIPGDTPPLI